MNKGEKSKLEITQFGEHITIDGYGGDPKLLNDKKIVSFVLSDLAKKLDMHTLSQPLVIQAPDNAIKDPGGWSGFVIIAESHIALHTFPKRRFVSADVYTCRNGLNPQIIIDYFTETFKLTDVETNFIKRGTRYPIENLL